MKANTLSWILALVAAVILLQTLFFKFTGAEESVFIFSTLGVEPWGRIFTGIMELIASVLLLIPAYRGFGALMGAGIMGGAILSHLFVLGIEIQGDGGYLFILGIVVLICSVGLIYLHRASIPVIRNVLPS